MSNRDELHIHKAWCSGCDRAVQVTVHPRVIEEGREPTAADLICLEHGEACTGALCPIFGVPSEEMKERYHELLDRASGADPEAT